MKNRLLMAFGLGWAMAAAAQPAGFGVEGIGSVTIPVTAGKMTNLIFPERVQGGVKVSREVLVQKVKGVENVIELKAMKRGFSETNLSVYGRDGRLYSFLLRYVEDTAVLNYRVVVPSAAGGGSVMLTGLPVSETRLREDGEELMGLRQFVKVCTRSERVRLRLTGVYLRDSLEWLVLSLSNGSAVPFGLARFRTYLLDSKRVRRKAEQEVEVLPVYRGEWSGVPAQVAVGFEPFTVRSGRRFVVELTGKDGRRVTLKVRGKVLLKARKA